MSGWRFQEPCPMIGYRTPSLQEYALWRAAIRTLFELGVPNFFYKEVYHWNFLYLILVVNGCLQKILEGCQICFIFNLKKYIFWAKDANFFYKDWLQPLIFLVLNFCSLGVAPKKNITGGAKFGFLKFFENCFFWAGCQFFLQFFKDWLQTLIFLVLNK